MASGIQPAPVVVIDPNDAAAVLRADGVLEVGFLFRKVIDARAQYAADHPNARSALQKCTERLTALLSNSATLTLEVQPTQFMIGTSPLSKTNNEPDPLAQSLFGDGARKVVFTRGLTPPQVATFFEIAARSRASNSDQSVMTDFWEAELANIRFVVATTFADAGSEVLNADTSGSRRTREEMINGLVSVFKSPDINAASEGDELPTMISLSAAELEVLSSTNLSGIERDSLRAAEAAGRASLLTVDSETVRGLRERISAPRADAAERLIMSLFDAHYVAPADLKPKVSAQLFALVSNLFETGRFEPVARAFDKHLQGARADPAIAAQRLPVMTQLRNSMLESTVIERLIASLDDEKLAPFAMPIIRIFGSGAVERVFDMVSRLQTAQGKTNVSKLLELMRPKPEVIMARARTASPEVARELVLLCNKQPLATAAPILAVLLQTTDAHIRRVAVRTIDRGVAPGVSQLLRKMIADPDRDVRLTVVRLLGFAEDQGSVDAMSRMLTRAQTDLAERREIYRALGEIGGLAAGDALAAEFARTLDTEQRIALAGSFNRAWSPKASQVLGEVASKLLTAAKLKQACRAAIANGEAQQANTAANPPLSSLSGIRQNPLQWSDSGSYSGSLSTIVPSPGSGGFASTASSQSGIFPMPGALVNRPSGLRRQPGDTAAILANLPQPLPPPPEPTSLSSIMPIVPHKKPAQPSAPPALKTDPEPSAAKKPQGSGGAST